MDDMSERVAALEANAKSIFHQLDEIKAVVNDVHSLATSVRLIAQQTSATDKKVDAIDRRLDTVERTPAEDAKHYKRVLWGCLIAEAVGILLGAVLMR